jgi:hypothetical protein
MNLHLYTIPGYLGPGLDGGIITAVLGVFVSIFLALFAILWYPFKKLIGKIRNKKNK